VFVALRAPGYPGSTYTLRYAPQRDQLEGSYVHAARQQRCAVVVVRMQEGGRAPARLESTGAREVARQAQATREEAVARMHRQYETVHLCGCLVVDRAERKEAQCYGKEEAWTANQDS
jgi:hypothetical protein